MTATNGEDWHEIVAGFLRALFDDARAQSSLMSPLNAFMEEYATANAHADYTRAAKNRLESLMPPPADKDWKTVSDQDDRLVVDVPVDRSNCNGIPIPIMSTRLLLVQQSGSWRLDDVFEQCTRCNLISNDHVGICSVCRGKGGTLGVTRHWFWVKWLVKGAILETEKCEFCNGTGKCQECANEDFPGWTRAYLSRHAPAQCLTCSK